MPEQFGTGSLWNTLCFSHFVGRAAARRRGNDAGGKLESKSLSTAGRDCV